MRRFVCVLAALACLLLAGSASLAQVITLHEAVDLREQPRKKCPVTVTVPIGSELMILGEGKDWVPVALNGRQYYAPAVQLIAATPSLTPSPDPTCDYGYPYSGSNQFFQRPLAQLRHSTPLGFLFGYHRFYPC